MKIKSKSKITDQKKYSDEQDVSRKVKKQKADRTECKNFNWRKVEY